MICSNCHQEIADGQAFCPNCGMALNAQPEQPEYTAQPQQPEYVAQPQQPEYTAQPQQPEYVAQPQQPQYTAQAQAQAQGAAPAISQTPYLVWAIIVTLLCCLPLGIGSIIYACKINSALAAGDYAGAQDAAKKSKLFSIIGAAAGLVVVIGYILYFVLVIGLAASGY
ncbi:MAG: CD225/dispanin family protein [Oscillospiraceae bacterium]|nr:CD225/dispanin family protein [Oscillospiraceae bacterium]